MPTPAPGVAEVSFPRTLKAGTRFVRLSPIRARPRWACTCALGSVSFARGQQREREREGFALGRFCWDAGRQTRRCIRARGSPWSRRALKWPPLRLRRAWRQTRRDSRLRLVQNNRTQRLVAESGGKKKEKKTRGVSTPELAGGHAHVGAEDRAGREFRFRLEQRALAHDAPRACIEKRSGARARSLATRKSISTRVGAGACVMSHRFPRYCRLCTR